MDQVSDLKFTEGAKLILETIEAGTDTDILIRTSTGHVKKRAFSTFPGVAVDRNVDGGTWDAVYLTSQTVNGGLFI